MPPRPPGTASRSSSHTRAASTARLRSGRVVKRSQILRPSSTAMKTFFQKSFRQLNGSGRSEEHTSELQSQSNLVCRLLLEKKKKKKINNNSDEQTSPRHGNCTG